MRSQRETREARRLLELKPSFSIGGASDIRAFARQAELGGRLEPAMLLEVQATLASGRNVKGAFNKLGYQFSALSDVVKPISELRPLEDDIGRAISPRGEVLDSASPVLARLRSGIRLAHDRLVSRLNDILASSVGQLAAQEPIITIREGRYVLPIKADMKGQLRGIIHDTSASGATVFMEPLSTVELNNRWRESQIEERHEIDRILRRLSTRVARLGQAIATNVECLAALDLSLAKARLAQAMQAAEPEVLAVDTEVRPLVRLVNARHPLLSGPAVPTTIEVGAEFSILVITGPNTGGKTVALKTAGLLTLMALAGLQVPAADGSKVSVVDGVYADIGDEQSIEQSLSTFSSHIGNIVDILKVAGRRSLVLLDELGAGTDPTEGSALARAILAYLLEKGISAIATTHFNELKAFAYTTPEVANASVEFDPETLTPTYKLIIGLPGRSNALAIAARLGLPEEIVANARDLLSPSQVQVENLLGTIQAERNEAELSRRAAEEKLAVIARLEEELRQRRAEIEAERAEAMAEAREEALAEAHDLLEQIRELNRATWSSHIEGRQLAEAQHKAATVEREIIKRLRRPASRPSSDNDAPVKPGDIVFIRHLRQTGEVVSEPDARGEVEVQLGSFKARVKGENLEKRSRRSVHHEMSQAPLLDFDVAAARSVPLQLDLRGRRAEEVVANVEQYLNDAYLSGLPYVRLVHGKGTGALRQVVREQLSSHPLVRSFSSAEDKDGGDGVTIAVLAL